MSVLMRGVQEIVPALSKQTIDKIFNKSAGMLIPAEELAKKIQKSIDTGVPLRIKFGVDPTAPDVHFGHTVVMRKLRQFQDMGHQVVLIVGDYTAMIGDPSGRNKMRPRLSHETVMENAKEYQEQLFKIVKKEQTEIRYNGEWFAKMSFEKVTELMGSITIAQMLERKDFQARYEQGQPISMHEFMYPLMQAYDSIEVKSDIELGGMDQKFNVLRGRELQTKEGIEPQIGVFMPILLGTDGEQKMSKTLGNYVGVNESAETMYHKIYNIADSLTASWFELLTVKPKEEFEDLIKKDILNAKKILALDIVSQYYGESVANAAAEREKEIHSGSVLPSDTPTIKLNGEQNILDLLISIGAFSSKGEARRMIQNSGVKIDGKTISDSNLIVAADAVLQVGKRKFYKLLYC